jgi:hypothetical protein
LLLAACCLLVLVLLVLLLLVLLLLLHLLVLVLLQTGVPVATSACRTASTGGSRACIAGVLRVQHPTRADGRDGT